MHLAHEVHEGELGAQDRWRAQIVGELNDGTAGCGVGMAISWWWWFPHEPEGTETSAQSSTKTILSASSIVARFTVEPSGDLRARSQISKCTMAPT